jgi:hypothetical protein
MANEDESEVKVGVKRPAPERDTKPSTNGDEGTEPNE